MQITATGWARNHGAVTVLELDLTAVDATEGQYNFGPRHSVLALGKGWSKSVRQVILNCFTTMKFTGDYALRVTLEKEEIARLYRLTHQDEIADLQRKIAALQDVSELFAEPAPLFTEPGEPAAARDPDPAPASIRRRF
jgi:hypothetical protein